MPQKKIKEVTRHEPCPHCGKPDWCYRLETLSVCNRDAEPATGWYKTSKTDQDGHYYYALICEKKSPRPQQRRAWEYPDRSGKPLVRVIRVDDGQNLKPKRWQEHWDGQKWVKGLKGIKREQIPIYKYEAIREAIAQGQTIFIVEGEPCADALWQIGIPATTNIGGSKKWKPSDTTDLEGVKAVVLCPDRDLPGVEHTNLIEAKFPNAQWLYAFPDSPIWQKLPESGGLDIADWIQDYQLTKEEVFEAVGVKRTYQAEIAISSPNKAKNNENHQLLSENPQPSAFSPQPSEDKDEIELHYTQKCVEALYSDKPWISIKNKLYYWTGTHYQQAKEGKEKKRISNWCYHTAVKTKYGWKYAYATAAHVDNIWRWLHSYFSYPIEDVNPSGINCLNGVVKIKWEGKKASWELVPHNPQVVYTYVSEIKFDEKADPTECNRMLSCLNESQQKLFLQTIAASLDLNTIRSFRGREVKALLCKGDGNNGKDTLREAVRMLFGQSMTNATVSDFANYDNGRKFSLAKLESALINWSSENSSFNNLDRLQSLKAAITGEPLDMERKGVDEQEMMLHSVFLFNINESPDLKAAMEAIQSRWAVLTFHKTYKINANIELGEIEADSRFRYDPNFLKTQVCPALLNKILDALSSLAIEGIDYSCTQQAIREIQEETNHLWCFVREVGLEECCEGRVYLNDLWELLFKWYVNNGTLEIQRENGKEKKIWHEQVRKDDKNVKSQNQIYQRFRELFPKIIRVKNNDWSDGIERNGQFYLSGLKLTSDYGFERDFSSSDDDLSFNQNIPTRFAPSLHQTKEMISYLTQGQQEELVKWLLTNYSVIPVNSSGLGISDDELITYETQHQKVSERSRTIVERKRHISTDQSIPSLDPFDSDIENNHSIDLEKLTTSLSCCSVTNKTVTDSLSEQFTNVNDVVNFESQQETEVRGTIVLNSIKNSQIQSKSSLGTEKMTNSSKKSSVNQVVSTAAITDSSSSENARSFPQPFSDEQQTQAKFDSTSITNAIPQGSALRRAKPLSVSNKNMSPLHLGDYVTLSDSDNTSDLAQVMAIKGDMISIKWYNSQIIEKYQFKRLKIVKNGE